LHPGEPFGFICTNGLLPTLGGAVWANAVAEKPIAARTSKTLIVNFPFAGEYTHAKEFGEGNQEAGNSLSVALSKSLSAPCAFARCPTSSPESV
jgi:hypothetical protein